MPLLMLMLKVTELRPKPLLRLPETLMFYKVNDLLSIKEILLALFVVLNIFLLRPPLSTNNINEINREFKSNIKFLL